jgi:transposase
MAFDVGSRTPVLSRFYEGAVLDKSSVRDLLSRAELAGKLFVVDSGFYSTLNLKAFTENGNSYIIPLQKNLNACKEAVVDTEIDGRFVYRKNRKASCVEYREHSGPSAARIILYRDMNKAALEHSGYLAKLEQDTKGYTEVGFERAKDVMGTIVLKTSRLDMSAQEVYETYKRRWSIETFFDYLKNGARFTSPGVKDYYKAQGLAFVMLVTALVHKGLEDACARVKGKSVDDCLVEARMVKANKVGTRWVLSNLLARQQDLFDALNTPLSMEALLQHT